MHDPIVTLTTDFGEDSPYVAAMKGVMLAINPCVSVVDLSHQIPPQDIRHTAFFLNAAVPYFPPETIHTVVVDPGVGSERALLFVELPGHRLLVPDNGCWTALARRFSETPRVRRLDERRFWRQPVSKTFHGRDILAPVAAHLSLGVAPKDLGPPVDNWVTLAAPHLIVEAERLVGEVEFIDGFGNLITNIPSRAYETMSQGPVRITVGDAQVSSRVRAYSEAEPGQAVALVSSADTLEIAVNRGNAAHKLGAEVGTVVTVTKAADRS